MIREPIYGREATNRSGSVDRRSSVIGPKEVKHMGIKRDGNRPTTELLPIIMKARKKEDIMVKCSEQTRTI